MYACHGGKSRALSPEFLPCRQDKKPLRMERLLPQELSFLTFYLHPPFTDEVAIAHRVSDCDKSGAGERFDRSNG